MVLEWYHHSNIQFLDELGHAFGLEHSAEPLANGKRDACIFWHAGKRQLIKRLPVVVMRCQLKQVHGEPKGSLLLANDGYKDGVVFSVQATITQIPKDGVPYT